MNNYAQIYSLDLTRVIKTVINVFLDNNFNKSTATDLLQVNIDKKTKKEKGSSFYIIEFGSPFTKLQEKTFQKSKTKK